MARHRPTIKLEIECWREGDGFYAECAKIKGALAYDETAPEAIYRCAAVVAAQIQAALPQRKRGT